MHSYGLGVCENRMQPVPVDQREIHMRFQTPRNLANRSERNLGFDNRKQIGAPMPLVFVAVPGICHYLEGRTADVM